VQAVDPRGRRSAVTRVRIVIKTPAPSDVTTIRVGRQPINTAFGAGAVWVANYGDNTLSRVDPSTNRSTLHLDLGAVPYGVAFGAGAVWMTTDFGSGAVFRIDPDSHAIVAKIPVGGTPTGLTFGDGLVWTANRDGSVERIDPATNTVVGRTVAGRPAIAISVGLGSAWVTTEDGAVFQLSSPVGALQGGAIAVGGDVDDVTVGGTSVWATSLTNRAVVQIDPSTRRIVSRFSPGGQASGVAYADGSLWISLYDSNVVKKFDVSGHLLKTLRVGYEPRGFTLGADSVWVSNQASGTISRFRP
jgi:streptogramin lyase